MNALSPRPARFVSLMGKMENDEKRNNHFNQVKHNSIFFFLLILSSANRAYTLICKPRKEFPMFTGRNITAEQKTEEEEFHSLAMHVSGYFPLISPILWCERWVCSSSFEYKIWIWISNDKNWRRSLFMHATFSFSFSLFSLWLHFAVLCSLALSFSQIRRVFECWYFIVNICRWWCSMSAAMTVNFMTVHIFIEFVFDTLLQRITRAKPLISMRNYFYRFSWAQFNIFVCALSCFYSRALVTILCTANTRIRFASRRHSLSLFFRHSWFIEPHKYLMPKPISK